MDTDKVFFEFICKTWEDGESRKPQIDDLYGYWTGENYKNPADSFFLKETRTNCNIIKQIVEAKLGAMLDAQFTAAVVPEIYAFSDMQEVSNMQAVADVMNSGMKRVLDMNKADDVKERVGRWGFLKFGASQVYWDTINDKQGIKIDVIDPRNLRWTKGAKSVEELTWVGYARSIDASILKKNYARNSDGSYDVELCQKIDQAAGIKIDTGDTGGVKAIGAYTNDGDNPSGGLAYVKESMGKGQGKSVTFVIMFLFDGSIDAPKEGDTTDEESMKEEMLMSYPNGRIVTFIPDRDKQIVLEDKEAPEAFKSMGNIDFFNTTDFGGFADGGEIDALVPIQERINGTYRKLRSCVGGSINTILFDERHRGLVGDDSFINLPINFIEGLGNFQPPVMNNGMIEQAAKLKELIEGYKQEARETARINETWMSGVQQPGTKSGDQVDSLNESAMASIRPLQRNFKDYYVSMCEKIVALMIENYTPDMFIEMATGTDNKQYASFDTSYDENGDEVKTLRIMDDQGNIVNTVTLSNDWKFRVEVSDGTEIPRTRKENARLVDEVLANPIMQSGNIAAIEMYLTAKDFPNRRAVVSLMKKQQQQAAQNPPPLLQQIGKSPELLKAWAAFITSISGYPNAIGQLLQKASLDPSPGTLSTLPISEVTSKSSVKEIAIIAPQQISKEVPVAQFGHSQATDLEILQHQESRPKMTVVP